MRRDQREGDGARVRTIAVPLLTRRQSSPRAAQHSDNRRSQLAESALIVTGFQFINGYSKVTRIALEEFDAALPIESRYQAWK